MFGKSILELSRRTNIVRTYFLMGLKVEKNSGDS
jgi:hypothetical protein